MLHNKIPELGVVVFSVVVLLVGDVEGELVGSTRWTIFKAVTV